MKDLIDIIKEKQNDSVYTVYFADGDGFGVFDTKQEADDCAAHLNRDEPMNKCKVVKEPRSKYVDETM